MKDNTHFLNDLAKRLSKAFPDHVQKMQKDAEKNFHAILQSGLSKLHLVTRDEFDAQAKVLARSRKKIEELETRLKDLEKRRRKKKSD